MNTNQWGDFQICISVPLKSKHGKVMCQIYEYLKFEKGKRIISSGWKATGITKAIKEGRTGVIIFIFAFNSCCTSLYWLINAYKNVDWKCYCSVFALSYILFFTLLKSVLLHCIFLSFLLFHHTSFYITSRRPR